MSSSLAQLLTETAAEHADRPALKLDDAVLNYAVLNEGATRVAGLLKEKGVAPGDRVGIMLPNVPYFGAVYYGILRAGGVVVPMNVLLKGREVAFYLKDSGAKFVFAWHDFGEAATEGASEAGAEAILVKPGEFEKLVMDAPRAEEDEPRAGDDTAVILYTSGTTGTPKGAELTHDNLRENCTITARTLVQITEEDMILGALPLFHSFGQTCGLNAAVATGACLTLIPRFDPTQGAGDHRPRQGHGARGRADDVPRDAQRARPRGRRHLEPARVRLRRLGDAGRGHEAPSRRRSTASSSRATGCRRPRRWPPSTTRTATASRARSARRSRASR